MNVAELEMLVRVAKMRVVHLALPLVHVVREGDGPTLPLQPHSEQTYPGEEFRESLLRGHGHDVRFDFAAQNSQGRFNAPGQILAYVALPESNHRPALRQKLGGDSAITAHISANFSEPVILRLRPLELIFESRELPLSPLAAVPEVAVNEDDRLMRRQNDVGLAR